MNDYAFLVNVAGALLAALSGALAARLLRLPVLVGYLAAGIVVGPYTPGLAADPQATYDVAKLGAALLMFAVGVQLSLKEMAEIKATALGGGAIQIGGTILLGVGLGMALGWGAYAGLFLGCAMSLTSTTIMMRVLEERGEVGEGHGAVMLGISVVQDLSLVAMVALLPALAELSTQGMGALGDVGRSILQAAVLVSVTLYFALKGAPFMLEVAARTGVREIFVLTVVCLCLAAAYGAVLAGLSLEIGAFLGGLVISESRYAHEVLTQVRPLRDLFASLFFVSVGMLMDVAFFWEHLPAVLAVVAAIILGKGLISFFAVYLLGWHGRTAILAGMGLGQIGEFSFVLAVIGADRELIPEIVSGVILSSAMISILLAPFAYAAAYRIYQYLNGIPAAAQFLNRGADAGLFLQDKRFQPRVIILGSGRVGRHISDTLTVKDVPHVVVDYNAKVVEHRRRAGVTAIFGDASSDVVLSQAHPESAEMAIVTLPDPGATEAAVRVLKRLAPDLTVIARVHRGADIPKVREAGADRVVHAEFEASMRLIRHSLRQLGFAEDEITAHVSMMRARRYRENQA